MAWIVLALVLLGSLLLAHAVELRRVASERARRQALTESQVHECLANIDRVIDLDHAVRLAVDLHPQFALLD
jgi:hypothetical protein